MDFKKKAGLALALAAIFTTGGANLALAAENVTNSSDLTDSSVVGDGNLNFQAETNPVINGAGGSAPINSVIVADGAADPILQGEVNFDGNGGTLVGKADGTPTSLVVDTGAIVNLGDSTNAAATTGTLGDMTFGSTGTLAANNGDYAIVADPVSGVAIDATAGALALNVDTGATLTVNGDVNLGTGSTIKVGSQGTVANTGSLIIAGALDLVASSSILLDPIWVNGNETNFARAAIASLDSDMVDGSVTVGENSRLTIGINDLTWINDVIAQTGRTWEDSVTAPGSTNFSVALGLNQYRGLIVDDSAGIIDVDDSVTNTATVADGTVRFENDSVFVVNAGKLYVDDYTDDANYWDETLFAITGSAGAGTGSKVVVIDDDAKLVVANAKAGTTVNILDNFDLDTAFQAGLDGWSFNANRAVSNLLFDVAFLTGSIVLDSAGGLGAADGTGDQLSVVVDEVDVADVRAAFPALSGGMASMVTDIYNEKANNTDDYTMMDNLDADGDGTLNHAIDDDDPANGMHDDLLRNNAGLQFVSRAVSGTYGATTAKAGAAILEGAAQIAVAGGVPYLTNNVITRISDLVVDHNEMLDASQPAYGNEPGKFALWVTPFYGMSDIDGMDAGRFDNALELNYGGAAFGFDYNINEAFRIGAALNLGSGDVDSDDSGFNDTNNDFDFFGGNLYGSWTNGAFGLTGDLGYTTFDNEMEQDLPAAMGMGSKLHSDVDSDAFTLGLTGKYRFAASDNFNIAPHLGLRYTKISIDDTDVKLADGRNIFRVDTEDQNLFQIPLGVEFSGNVVTGGGWTVKPRADLGVLFTAGDTDVDSRARITNTGYGTFNTGSINAEVIDEVAFTGALGVQAAADNGMSLGLDYNLLASGNQTDHQFSGMLRFEF